MNEILSFLDGPDLWIPSWEIFELLLWTSFQIWWGALLSRIQCFFKGPRHVCWYSEEFFVKCGWKHCTKLPMKSHQVASKNSFKNTPCTLSLSLVVWGLKRTDSLLTLVWKESRSPSSFKNALSCWNGVKMLLEVWFWSKRAQNCQWVRITRDSRDSTSNWTTEAASSRKDGAVDSKKKKEKEKEKRNRRHSPAAAGRSRAAGASLPVTSRHSPATDLARN